MARLRIVPENHHDVATLSVSATAAVGFDIENTQNTLRDDVWRTTTNAGQYYRGLLPASRSASFFGLFRHNAGGGNVRLRLYSDTAWTTGVYDSTAVAANCFTNSDTYDWGKGTTDPFIAVSPFVLWFNAVTFRSYEVAFSGTPSSGDNFWQVCRTWLGLAFEFGQNPAEGVNIDLEDMTDSHRTRGGSQRTNEGENYRTGNFDLNYLVNGPERSFVIDLSQDRGLSKDFVISLYPTLGTREERDWMMNAKFIKTGPLAALQARLTKKLNFQEQ